MTEIIICSDKMLLGGPYQGPARGLVEKPASCRVPAWVGPGLRARGRDRTLIAAQLLLGLSFSACPATHVGVSVLSAYKPSEVDFSQVQTEVFPSVPYTYFREVVLGCLSRRPVVREAPERRVGLHRLSPQPLCCSLWSCSRVTGATQTDRHLNPSSPSLECGLVVAAASRPCLRLTRNPAAAV